MDGRLEKSELISAEPLETVNPCSGFFRRREPQLTEQFDQSFEKKTNFNETKPMNSNFKQT
jgi:hypothetical protein